MNKTEFLDFARDFFFFSGARFPQINDIQCFVAQWLPWLPQPIKRCWAMAKNGRVRSVLGQKLRRSKPTGEIDCAGPLWLARRLSRPFLANMSQPGAPVFWYGTSVDFHPFSLQKMSFPFPAVVPLFMVVWCSSGGVAWCVCAVLGVSGVRVVWFWFCGVLIAVRDCQVSRSASTGGCSSAHICFWEMPYG